MEGKAHVDGPQLTELRCRIDEIDGAILDAIASRYRIAEEVGRLKDQAAMPALDPSREAEIVRRASERARAAGVPAEGVRQIFWALLDCCRKGVQGQLSATGAVGAFPSDG
jgi:chorismate mutase